MFDKKTKILKWVAITLGSIEVLMSAVILISKYEAHVQEAEMTAEAIRITTATMVATVAKVEREFDH